MNECFFFSIYCKIQRLQTHVRHSKNFLFCDCYCVGSAAVNLQQDGSKTSTMHHIQIYMAKIETGEINFLKELSKYKVEEDLRGKCS